MTWFPKRRLIRLISFILVGLDAYFLGDLIYVLVLITSNDRLLAATIETFTGVILFGYSIYVNYSYIKDLRNDIDFGTIPCFWCTIEEVKCGLFGLTVNPIIWFPSLSLESTNNQKHLKLCLDR